MHHDHQHAPAEDPAQHSAQHAAQHTAQHASGFDERAATWDDDPAKVARSAAVAEAIRAQVPLGPQTRFLEYGAGTGLLTQSLRADVGPVVLVDTSAGMRAVLAEKIADGRLPADAGVWDVDLATSPPPQEQVDVIASVLALHHVADVEAVLSRLGELLVPGGWLCVSELDTEDGAFHGEGFDGHLGFGREAFVRQLMAAGFVDVTVTDSVSITKDDGEFTSFLATARRP